MSVILFTVRIQLWRTLYVLFAGCISPGMCMSWLSAARIGLVPMRGGSQYGVLAVSYQRRGYFPTLIPGRNAPRYYLVSVTPLQSEPPTPARRWSDFTLHATRCYIVSPKSASIRREKSSIFCEGQCTAKQQNWWAKNGDPKLHKDKSPIEVMLKTKNTADQQGGYHSTEYAASVMNTINVYTVPNRDVNPEYEL